MSKQVFFLVFYLETVEPIWQISILFVLLLLFFKLKIISLR